MSLIDVTDLLEITIVAISFVVGVEYCSTELTIRVFSVFPSNVGSCEVTASVFVLSMAVVTVLSSFSLSFLEVDKSFLRVASVLSGSRESANCHLLLKTGSLQS